MANLFKPRSGLQQVQLVRKVAVALVGVALAFLFLATESRWRAVSERTYEAIEIAGSVLIFAGIIGRTWCTLYIGGRKRSELVTVGPYSLTRNPLYVFSFVAAVGIGAQAGSLALAALFGAAMVVVFLPVVLREEASLAQIFPAEFAAYRAQVRRFAPRLSGWRDVDEITVRTGFVRSTFLDASIFLLAIPAGDVVDLLRGAGVIGTLFRLY